MKRPDRHAVTLSVTRSLKHIRITKNAGKYTESDSARIQFGLVQGDYFVPRLRM